MVFLGSYISRCEKILKNKGKSSAILTQRIKEHLKYKKTALKINCFKNLCRQRLYDKSLKFRILISDVFYLNTNVNLLHIFWFTFINSPLRNNRKSKIESRCSCTTFFFKLFYCDIFILFYAI